MLNRMLVKATIAVALTVSVIAIPACKSTGANGAKMATDNSQAAHERHATGLGSQTADLK